jgi:hypothetical protein
MRAGIKIVALRGNASISPFIEGLSKFSVRN